MKAISILVGVLLIVAGGAAYYTKYMAPIRRSIFARFPSNGATWWRWSAPRARWSRSKSVDVGSQVTGPIASLGKDPKDPSKSIDWDSEVEEGTLLAKVDDSIYLAQRDQAQANLLHAQADLGELQAKVDQTKAEWNRAKALVPQKAIADTDYDLDVANYMAAKAILRGGQGDRQAERGGPGNGPDETLSIAPSVRPSRA